MAAGRAITLQDDTSRLVPTGLGNHVAPRQGRRAAAEEALGEEEKRTQGAKNSTRASGLSWMNSSKPDWVRSTTSDARTAATEARPATIVEARILGCT